MTTADTEEKAKTQPENAASLLLCRLKKRSDFLRAAKARKQVCRGFILQARDRSSQNLQHATIRVGFTCSKRVGNAVERNRAKRRLREISRFVLPYKGRAGWDYVLIGRAGHTANIPFLTLQSQLSHALDRIHGRPS